MSIINQILSDFYHCTHLPIQFLDEQLKQVDFMGQPSLDIPAFEMKGLTLNAITSFTTDDAHHYIILPFNESSHQTGFFLIGAYQSLQVDDKISYRPQHLTTYFEELLISIVKKNIMNTTEANPHISKGIQYIHDHYHESISLPQLCDYLNLNMCYFCVLFKNQTTMTFSQYLNRVRINESKKLLEETDDSIIDISLSVGFNNHNHFSATFKKLAGMTPTQYRNQLKK